MIPVSAVIPIWAGPFGGGPVPPQPVTAPNTLPPTAQPSALLATLRTDGEGQVVWGSLDSQTTNTSVWSFVRYQISPDENTITSRGLIVDTEMGVLPEDNPNYEWFQGASFGQSRLYSVGPATFLGLKSTVGSADLFYAFYYQRIEPFLQYQSIFDLDARYLVDYGTQGSGDARIAIQDTTRYIEVANLLYVEPSAYVLRRIISNPYLSYAGLYEPTDQLNGQWAKSGFITGTAYERVLTTSTPNASVRGYYEGTLDAYNTLLTGTVTTGALPASTLQGVGTKFLQEVAVGDFIKTEDGRTFTITNVASSQEEISVAPALTASYTGVLYRSPYPDTGSRVTEVKLKVFSTGNSVTAPDTGIYFTAKANGRIYTVYLRYQAGLPIIQLQQNGPASAVLLSVPFNWADQAFHYYMLWADAAGNNVSLLVDDTLLGNVPLNNFSASATHADFRFGHNNGTSVVGWETLSHVWTPPASARRTLGVWLGGDRTDIDNWQIPRTDNPLGALPAVPNSEANGADIVQMDWTNPIEVRVHRDPTFGVSIYRPDLANPPWYVAGDFNSEYTNPTQAWINVDETRLPMQTGEAFGSVAFGAIDPLSVSHQSWDYVRYRTYQWPDQDFRSPQHHVLNYANQLGSTELFGQTEPESVVVESLDNRTVSLIPTNFYAQSIVRVIDGQNLISATQWTFNPETQTVTLGVDANGFPVTFSSDHAAITLVFVAGTPVTQTYLESVPWSKTATLLNEGTPPFVYQQAQAITRNVVAGAVLFDPTIPTEFIDNTPYDTLEFLSPFSVVPDLSTTALPPFYLPPPAVPNTAAQVPAAYQTVDVYEVDNGAQQNLIAICDDGPFTLDFSASTGPNTVVIGPQFNEYAAPHPLDAEWEQAGLFPAGPTSTAGVLRLSGGTSIFDIATSSASNPAIITTTNDHGFHVGSNVLVYGHSTAGVNGLWTVIGVPAPNQFAIGYNNAAAGTGGQASVGHQNDVSTTTMWQVGGTLGPAGHFVLAPSAIGQQVIIGLNGVPIFP